MIEITQRNGVAVLTMDDGKANTIDTDLCDELIRTFDSALTAGAQAVVLTGARTIFSAGVDLRRVIAGGPAYISELLAALRRMFTYLASFELPLVAAVNGHALAGGFILLAVADWVVIADTECRLGVTELVVGVPFPMVALELLRMRAGRATSKLVIQGATVSVAEAMGHGLVDEVAPTAEFMERSLAAARRLIALGPAFRITKRQLRLQLEDRVRRGSELDIEVDRIWSERHTLRRIRSYMDEISRPH